MRLLLDEHYSPEIARQLRRRGHDATAVSERADILGLADDELLRRMAAERKAILTNDVVDFRIALNRFLKAGEDHYGVLFTSDKSMPRRRATIGLFVRILGKPLGKHAAEDAYRSRVGWISG